MIVNRVDALQQSVRIRDAVLPHLLCKPSVSHWCALVSDEMRVVCMGKPVLWIIAVVNMVSTSQRPSVASLVFGGVFAMSYDAWVDASVSNI